MVTKVYLHGDKEYMYDKGVELGLSGEALRTFSYSCYEVEVTLNVNEKTGYAEIFQVNGRNVE